MSIALRPTTPKSRDENIRIQKGWYEKRAAPAYEAVSGLGAVILGQTWLIAEMLVALPEENFDGILEEVSLAPGVTGYHYPERLISPDSTL